MLCTGSGEILYTELTDLLFKIPGHWTLRRCINPQCGLIWLDPMPITEQIPLLYLHYYTHHIDSDPTTLKKIYESLLNGILAAGYGYLHASKSRFWKLTGRFLNLFRDIHDRFGGEIMWLHSSLRGRVLDVGCGNGAILKKLKDLGWQVEGTETDSSVVQRLAEDSILVHHGILEELPIQPASFDVITMKHVLEHLPDPLQTFMKAKKILKPGGRLVLSTPNTNGFGHRHFNQHWRGLEPPRHLYLYNPSCLQEILHRTGFVDIQLRTVSRGIAQAAIMSRLIKKNQHSGKYMDHSHLMKLALQYAWLVPFYQFLQSSILTLCPTRGETILATARNC